MNSTTAALTGGTELVALFSDGTHETVKVRQLPVRLLPKYLEAQNDEPAMVALFVDRPAEWVDCLSLKSFVAILEEGERMNADDFFAWFGRMVRRAERLVPGSSGELGKAKASPSPIGSPSARSAAV